jgi:hypothetical protein
MLTFIRYLDSKWINKEEQRADLDNNQSSVKYTL